MVVHKHWKSDTPWILPVFCAMNSIVLFLVLQTNTVIEVLILQDSKVRPMFLHLHDQGKDNTRSEGSKNFSDMQRMFW